VPPHTCKGRVGYGNFPSVGSIGRIIYPPYCLGERQP
jgi:hypothetical protein